MRKARPAERSWPIDVYPGGIADRCRKWLAPTENYNPTKKGGGLRHRSSKIADQSAAIPPFRLGCRIRLSAEAVEFRKKSNRPVTQPAKLTQCPSRPS